MQCKSNNRECFEKLPLGQQQAQTNMTTAGESEAVSVAEKPEDKDKALYSELLSTVIDSLVKSFSKNTMVSYAPIATPVATAPATPPTQETPLAKSDSAAVIMPAVQPAISTAEIPEKSTPATQGKKSKKSK